MNEAKIKKLCGVTAFKKGKTYFQGGKVQNLLSSRESPGPLFSTR
jgi:hypothetical protein